MADQLGAFRDRSQRVEDRLKIACHTVRRDGRALLGDREATLTRWVCDELCSAYSKKTR